MKGTVRLVTIMGIAIDIHVTFFLLLGVFFLLLGFKGIILILGVFFFVTMHEFCHSIAAAYFGIKVKKITLLPIGGVASMSEMPKKPYQELIISLAGPVSNFLVVVIFYYPLYLFLGKETLMYPFLVLTGQAAYAGQLNVIAHIYWINLILAVFNMIPAFPMDGGRVLRAILSSRMSYREATKIAVGLGHIFALLFAYFGIVYGHIFLLLVAVFIYMAASSEGAQVEVRETIKKYRVSDVLADDFVYIAEDATLAKVLELMFHTHQEDYPVIKDDILKGMATRREIMKALHERDKNTCAGDIMRKDIPSVKVTDQLHFVQRLMHKYATNAMPVKKDYKIIGVVTIDDINRVYMMVHDQ
ncbi:MAG: site-2 protease family protein [Candidatus Omnitrophota bacterium]